MTGFLLHVFLEHPKRTTCPPPEDVLCKSLSLIQHLALQWSLSGFSHQEQLQAVIRLISLYITSTLPATYSIVSNLMLSKRMDDNPQDIVEKQTSQVEDIPEISVNLAVILF